MGGVNQLIKGRLRNYNNNNYNNNNHNNNNYNIMIKI